MAAGDTVSVPVVVASEMQGGGGSTTVSDDHEQQVGDAGGHCSQAEDLGQAPKQSSANGDLWPTAVVDSLIDQFEDIKVMKLNMGNLRSQHWSDIAASLNTTFKTNYDWKQCKNKVDLLIRLYKKSKLRMLNTDSTPTWRFFDRMDSILGRSFKVTALASNSRQTRAKLNSESRPTSSPVTNNVETAEDEDDENDEPPGQCEEEEEEDDEQQRTVSSPRTSERADEIDYRAVTTVASVRKKNKKSGRSSTSSAINLLVGALNHYTQAFERCKQLEIDAQLRMSQESRAFQLQIAEMQLEVTKEIVRVLGKRRRG